jgi:uncharacterized protein YpmS
MGVILVLIVVIFILFIGLMGYIQNANSTLNKYTNEEVIYKTIAEQQSVIKEANKQILIMQARLQAIQTEKAIKGK